MPEIVAPVAPPATEVVPPPVVAPPAEVVPPAPVVAAPDRTALSRQMAEKRQIEADRAVVATERAAVTAEAAKIATQRRALEKLGVDPVSALRELGVDPDATYNRITEFKTGASNPAIAGVSEAQRATDARLAALETERQQERAAAIAREQSANIDAYRAAALARVEQAGDALELTRATKSANVVPERALVRARSQAESIETMEDMVRIESEERAKYEVELQEQFDRMAATAWGKNRIATKHAVAPAPAAPKPAASLSSSQVAPAAGVTGAGGLSREARFKLAVEQAEKMVRQ